VALCACSAPILVPGPVADVDGWARGGLAGIFKAGRVGINYLDQDVEGEVDIAAYWGWRALEQITIAVSEVGSQQPSVWKWRYYRTGEGW